MRYAAFGGRESGDDTRNVFRLEMCGANVAEPVVAQIEAAEVPVICLPLTRPVFPLSVLTSLAGLELADQPQEG